MSLSWITLHNWNRLLTRIQGSKALCVKLYDSCYFTDFKVFQKREKEKALLVSVNRELSHAIFVAVIIEITI